MIRPTSGSPFLWGLVGIIYMYLMVGLKELYIDCALLQAYPCLMIILTHDHFRGHPKRRLKISVIAVHIYACSRLCKNSNWIKLRSIIYVVNPDPLFHHILFHLINIRGLYKISPIHPLNCFLVMKKWKKRFHIAREDFI